MQKSREFSFMKITKILAGLILGALMGFGANYLCKITGGACPLISNIIVSIILWALIGGMVAASMAFK